jgi:cell division protein FtsQ
LPKGSLALLLGAAKFGLMLAIGYGVLYGAQEAYDYATTSPRFELRSLIYEPTTHLGDDDLRQRLGLEPGTNILAVEPDELAEKVAAHPWIASATVLRHLPDTLEVRVTEREPAAVLLADQFYLVDADGIPFKRIERGERGQLPIITGVARRELADLSRPAAKVGQALAILEEYKAKQRPRLSEIHLDEDGGVSLYTAVTGTRLWLGRAEAHRGLERYDALRAALGSRAEGLELVHLDGEAAPEHPERVVARFVSDRDEAAVLAEGLEAPEPQAEPEDEAEAPSISRPKRRIPRYH